MITNQDLEFVRNYSRRKRARDEILDRIRERVDVHSVQYDKILAKGGPERDRMAEHVAAIDEAERRFQIIGIAKSENNFVDLRLIHHGQPSKVATPLTPTLEDYYLAIFGRTWKL